MSSTAILPPSLPDALPISRAQLPARRLDPGGARQPARDRAGGGGAARRGLRGPHPLPPRGRDARRLRSEEHTSELQSRFDLVCRLLLDKRNITYEKRFADP